MHTTLKYCLQPTRSNYIVLNQYTEYAKSVPETGSDQTEVCSFHCLPHLTTTASPLTWLFFTANFLLSYIIYLHIYFILVKFYWHFNIYFYVLYHRDVLIVLFYYSIHLFDLFIFNLFIILFYSTFYDFIIHTQCDMHLTIYILQDIIIYLIPYITKLQELLSFPVHLWLCHLSHSVTVTPIITVMQWHNARISVPLAIGQLSFFIDYSCLHIW